MPKVLKVRDLLNPICNHILIVEESPNYEFALEKVQLELVIKDNQKMQKCLEGGLKLTGVCLKMLFKTRK